MSPFVKARIGWIPIGALLVAVAASIAFLVDGLTASAYVEYSSGSDSEAVTRTTSTLVEVNGTWVIYLLVLPLVASLLVSIALGTGALVARARTAALVGAWLVTGAIAVFNLLAMLTIGFLVIPVTMALVIACIAVTVTPPAGRSVAAYP